MTYLNELKDVVPDLVVSTSSSLLHVPFKFEFAGSQIIFFEPAEDYSAAERARAEQEILPFRELHLVA